MADEKTADRLYDIERMSENSAILDHEIQRFVVLLRSVPDEKIRTVLLRSMGSLDFLDIADNLRQLAVAFLRSNEAINRFLQEIKASMEEEKAEQLSLPGGEAALTPEEVDPVFAEAAAQRQEDDHDK